MPYTPGMGWFGNSQGERVAELERLISALTARVVKAEATAADCAERAYRYMKKAEARSRRELDETAGNQEARPAASVSTPPTVSSSHRAQWGPRARRLARLARRDPADEPESPVNGEVE